VKKYIAGKKVGDAATRASTSGAELHRERINRDGQDIQDKEETMNAER
jgi:hypothetical protein